MVKKFLIIIFLILLTPVYAQDNRKIFLKSGKHKDFYRFVFICEKSEITNSININLLNDGKIKIFFPDIFEIEYKGRILEEEDNIRGIKTLKKDKVLIIETSDIEEIKVARYDSPSRLVIDAYFKESVERQKVLKSLSILIDPGHGGKDTGFQIKENREKDIAIYIAKTVASRLTQKGIKASLTRASDEDLTLSRRMKIENSLKPSLFLSIHLCSSDNFYIYTSPGIKNPDIMINPFIRKLKEKFSEPVYTEKLPLFLLEKSVSPALMIEIPKRALSDKNYTNRVIDALVQAIIEKFALVEEKEKNE